MKRPLRPYLTLALEIGKTTFFFFLLLLLQLPFKGVLAHKNHFFGTAAFTTSSNEKPIQNETLRFKDDRYIQVVKCDIYVKTQKIIIY